MPAEFITKAVASVAMTIAVAVCAYKTENPWCLFALFFPVVIFE